jgi:hypothetical protein
MKFSVILAIFVSIVTIGFASWYRFFQPQTISNVAALQPVQNKEIYDDEALLQDFIDPNSSIFDIAATSTPPEENLTGTNVASRNLILSYLDLATSGQEIDTQAINNLGTQYANSITNFHKFDKAAIQDIVVVTDSTVNAGNYAEGFLKIYTNYATKSQLLSGNTNLVQASTNSYKAAAGSMRTIYTGMANDLKKLAVPSSIAQLHLELINGYLSNAQAMTDTHTLDTDPITTMAGLTLLKEGANREAQVLKTIDEMLRDKWGII